MENLFFLKKEFTQLNNDFYCETENGEYMYTGEQIDDRIEMIRTKILDATIPFASFFEWDELVNSSKIEEIDQINKTVDLLVDQINNFNK